MMIKYFLVLGLAFVSLGAFAQANLPNRKLICDFFDVTTQTKYGPFESDLNILDKTVDENGKWQDIWVARIDQTIDKNKYLMHGEAMVVKDSPSATPRLVTVYVRDVASQAQANAAYGFGGLATDSLQSRLIVGEVHITASCVVK